MISKARPEQVSHRLSGPNHNGSRKDHAMAPKALLPPDILRQLLRYEPETGKLFWKERGTEIFHLVGRSSGNHAPATFNARFSGKEALTAIKNSGHLHGLIFQRLALAHRVAWAIYYGVDAAENIDHINHDPADNRISNLRLASFAENAKNRSPNRGKASGLPHGVAVKHNASGPRYFAQICVDKKNRHLGYFDTAAEASNAYSKAAKSYGFHENHAIIKALMAQEGE